MGITLLGLSYCVKEKAMNLKEANRVLDFVRDGRPQPNEKIRIALELTGDLQQSSEPLRDISDESPYLRSRQIYGKAAYERVFGAVQESGSRRQTED